MKFSHAFVLALGLIVSAIVFGRYHYNSRVVAETVEVVGAATERFESDFVKWRITISQSTGLDDLAGGYRVMDSILGKLRSALVAGGFDEEDISVQPINSFQNYDQGKPVGYNLNQSVTLITDRLEAVEELALNPITLVDAGVSIQNSNLEYFSSAIDSLKKSLLARATEDARERAIEIVSTSGRSLGEVKSLRAGVFQIREPYSTDVSGYGVYNTSSREKDITVTVRASFEIK